MSSWAFHSLAAMEVFRSFLESSTIHGLSYISSTKSNARFFWSLVVVAGFTGAIFIINASFQSWSESPIKTMVETIPIIELKFPKVTVCPPKNTFTDMNYDLMTKERENMTLTDEERNDILSFAAEIILKDVVDNYTKLQEQNRFFNWYHGYTRFYSPKLGYTNLLIETAATSGTFTSKHFGEKFKADLVEKKARYSITLKPPRSIENFENVTLHLKLEKISMTGLKLSEKDEISVFGLDTSNSGLTKFYKNFTPGAIPRELKFCRIIKTTKTETMPLHCKTSQPNCILHACQRLCFKA